MKNLIIILFLALSSGAYAQSTKPATVEQYEGIYLYIDSKPVDSLVYMGTVRVYLVWSDNPKAMKKALLKKTKRKFPNAQAVIWKLDDYDKFQVFSFK